ncbi:hypothetical protein AB0D57_13480 [Streptomyces sp. NPDC048275]|uniref:hypothetical protein n=1 Tax=Streptomyces sp. NPDC048275 TaxID=3155629 RepID=UPI0033D4E64E
MARLRRIAVALGAVVLVGSAVPAVHAADDQGAPRHYDSGLARTPYMGWNTSYGLGAPTEGQVRKIADRLVHLVGSGLRDSGYNIAWLDGGVLAAFRGVDGRVHRAGR